MQGCNLLLGTFCFLFLSMLLHEVLPLFQTPATLPPSRPTNHAIHLEPNTKPVNVRPYRYPYFQKQEIKRQVKDMLRR